MLRGEHSAILLTIIKLLFVIKIFVLSIFEWLFYTGFTVHVFNLLLGLGLVMQNAGNYDGAVKQYTEIIKVRHFRDLNPKLN